MNRSSILEAIKVESIFHPSDLSHASEIAFVHALKIALVTEAKLTVLHVKANSNAEWQDSPGVRETLERWKLLPKNSPVSMVGQLGIGVEKVIASGQDPVTACLGFLERHSADLIVLAIHQHNGHMRWLAKPVAAPIARAAGQMTLFIPHGVAGFVSREDGAISLRNILIPVTTKPRPQPSVEAVTRMIQNLRLPGGSITVLHAGSASEAPSLRLPVVKGWTWERLVHAGEPSQTILQVAKQRRADLIVMTTEGPDGFLDGLRGSTSERVLRTTRCPLLSLPVGSLLG